ncbi:MAG: 5-methyltetrahydropteroyltriglutamate--homocysteine S-methyltransferase [bacterium]
MKIIAANIGYPYIGEKRELKFLIESFWRGGVDRGNLLKGAEQLIKSNLLKQGDLDSIPVCDATLSDRMLDLTVAFGLIPKRFHHISDEIQLYFEMARGKSAMEMTKWFNTNYHYLVPELTDDLEPRLNGKHFVDMFKKNKASNVKVTLIGPYTFVKLSKGHKDFDKWFHKIANIYIELIDLLVKEGAEYIQIEEPMLVTDIPKKDLKYLKDFLGKLSGAKIILATYFDSITHYRETVNLPVDCIGMDFVSNTENLANVKKFGFPKDKVLMAGIVNGRNIWVSDLKAKISLCQALIKKIKPTELIISPSCSMQHVPVNAQHETALPKVLRDNLAFADEKIQELLVIKKALTKGIGVVKEELAENSIRLKELQASKERNLKDVKARLKKLTASHFKRASAFAARKKIQQKALGLPLLPATTIGSFPQTEEVRLKRMEYRKGKLNEAEYRSFIKDQIKEIVKLQEEIGLDVLVHGEFERTDMVEFFGEKLSGFATSLNGWVVSYGSRCVKPPIIWADVKRMRPMTIEEIVFAQSLTKKPMKGMLTGPMTIISWSFNRDDIQKKDVAYQIALALNNEVLDLEKKGIRIIQIDEPALQEGAPIKDADKIRYFDYGVKAFRLAASRVKDSTQVHTHMCYSNFNEIIKYIDLMDADVISIENSRSKGELLDVFKQYKYKKGIGPGVYDIHSPAIPTVPEMVSRINRSLKYLSKDQLWVNPDCGLKTRGYKETVPSLKNMVDAAEIVRQKSKNNA